MAKGRFPLRHDLLEMTEKAGILERLFGMNTVLRVLRNGREHLGMAIKGGVREPGSVAMS